MDISFRENYTPSRTIIVAVADINQWAMDFVGNYYRIRSCILAAKKDGASYLLTPEMCVTGYSCEDHFLEIDTCHHNYEVLGKLLADKELYGIVVEVGALVHHSGVRYNARVVFYNGQILCIRPKTVLANDSNYHEGRWFTAFKQSMILEWKVPYPLDRITNQTRVPFGVCLLQFIDTCIGFEICEELFVPANINQAQVLNGAEIITNGSGSHFQVGKLKNRFDLVLSSTYRGGCAYLYSNMVGCDGGRLYFDGGSFISTCGRLVEHIPRFELATTEYKVISTMIDLDEIKNDRSTRMSWANSAATVPIIPRVNVDISICLENCIYESSVRKGIPFMKIVEYYDYELEIIKAPVCYLWDYIRRTKLNGFFLALSGGADSASVAALIYILCFELFKVIERKDNHSELVLKYLSEITKESGYIPLSPQDLCNKLLVTANIPTKNNSQNSRKRASDLAEQINSRHLVVPIDGIIDSFVEAISSGLNIPKVEYKVNGGNYFEDLSLQNLQARSRMIISYAISQLYPGRKSCDLPLLVMGTSNADETLTGYFTKYDASSADLNIIGGIGKTEIIDILRVASKKYGLTSLDSIIGASPSAELVPTSHSGDTIQNDEDDMGFTYEELNAIRCCRKTELCGPLTMYTKLLYGSKLKGEKFTPEYIANLVKRFFVKYSLNRHKTTTLTPSMHFIDQSVDDNRGDFRPFLYNPDWDLQFNCINYHLNEVKKIGLFDTLKDDSTSSDLTFRERTIKKNLDLLNKSDNLKTVYNTSGNDIQDADKSTCEYLDTITSSYKKN